MRSLLKSVVYLLFLIISLHLQAQPNRVSREETEYSRQMYTWIKKGINHLNTFRGNSVFDRNVISSLAQLSDRDLRDNINIYDAGDEFLAALTKAVTEIKSPLYNAKLAKEYIEILKKKNAGDLQQENRIEQNNAKSSSAYFQIIDFVKSRVNEEWLKKDEFEKSTDYTTRLKTKSNTYFTDICYRAVSDALEKQKPGDMELVETRVKLLEYNADSEKFGLEFIFNSVRHTDSIPVPVSNAVWFRDNFYRLSVYVEDYDWRFGGKNKILFPWRFSLYNNTLGINFTLFTRRNDLKLISLTPAECELKPDYFTSAFDYTKALVSDLLAKEDSLNIELLTWNLFLSKEFEETSGLFDKIEEYYSRNGITMSSGLLTNKAHLLLAKNKFEEARKLYLKLTTEYPNKKSLKKQIFTDFKTMDYLGLKIPDAEKIISEISGL